MTTTPFSAIDQPAAMRSGEALDVAGLESYLLANVDGLCGPLTVEQFPRGFSNLTYLLRLGDRELVLRRPPFGAAIKSAHDMKREHHVLHCLHGFYAKAPRPLLYCADESVVGAPFYVMERVRGVILRNRIPAGLQISEATMRRICESTVDTLAELHAVDWRAAGLGDLGKPDGYVERQVRGWAQRYTNAATGVVPAMESVADWLTSHLPTSSGAVLIHNDFKLDNLVLASDDLSRVLAVLDWEMATIGDPLMDLGTTLGYWVQAGDAPELQFIGLTTYPGSMTRTEVVQRYAAASGRDVGNVLFYFVFGLFKIAVIAQQIFYRYHHGHTQDPRFATLDRAVAASAEMAVQAIARDAISA